MILCHDSLKKLSKDERRRGPMGRELRRDGIEPLHVSVSTISHYPKRVSGRTVQLVQKHINRPKMSKKRKDDRWESKYSEMKVVNSA